MPHPRPVRRRTQSRERLIVGALMLAAVLFFALATQRLAAQDVDPVAGGALMLRGKGVAEALPAVRLGTDMAVTVSGQVARVRVTQAFRNTSDQWMEASYLYPLPDDAAVDSLKMVVGSRIFIGRIERRAEARAAYEKARDEGRQAGLVESERPNLFRNDVANVGPGQTVLIAIEYQAPVRQLSGEYALRLPLVVGPRYVPPHSLASPAVGPDPAAIADAGLVTAPLSAPSLGDGLNPVSITIELAPGFEPANLVSPYHRIVVTKAGPMQRTVTLAAGQEPANRDFELRWRSASADPVLGLFRQEHGGQHYLMAAISPPSAIDTGTAPAREMVFVIDNSGSMGGESMGAAKASLLHALDTLRPADSFNVIRFDDKMTRLFEHSMPATADQIALARTFTQGLEASGGTEMLPALKSALADPTPQSTQLRQVVFLTDGDLSNEREMMAEIAANGGRSRVFMVGIGSAPNQYLMRRMAEAGRGTYTNIGNGAEVETKMQALLDRLRAPALRALAVRVDGAPLELTPERLPDLYAGEPLVLLGKGAALSGSITVSGQLGNRPWSTKLDLTKAVDSPAVARLWASRRVADIEAKRWSGQIEDEAADAAIAEIGLAYSLVTTQTSLIAEDKTPVRPIGARLTREDLPLLLPARWDFDTLMGGDAQASAPSASTDADQTQAIDLPQTATGYAQALLRGLLIALIGVAGLALTRRRNREYQA